MLRSTLRFTPFPARDAQVEKILTARRVPLALTVQMLPAIMTSLPTPVISRASAFLPLPGAEISREESEQHLLRAFRSFAEAADSLERSYGMLRGEVARLNRELEQSNAGLARSLQENRRMREYLDRIVEGLPCGVLVAKVTGEITLINPEGKRLLAASAAASTQESLPQACAVTTLHMLPTGVRDLLERARRGGNEQEHCFAAVSCDERWLAVRHAAIPSCDLESEIQKHDDAFILREISEAKRLARERERMRRQQALAEMSAVLAHEVRNPLGSLELFAGLLAGSALPEECRGWVEQVQTGLRALAATVNNVLHFHSPPPLGRVAVDLGQLLDWAAGFLMPMARQARVQLFLCNHLHQVTLPADRHRLEQVLLNLALNALRAMPGGGWIEISGRRMGEVASISLSDTGPGIAPSDMDRIFQAGFSTRAGSPGLGLAVCRKITEQHGGTLTAANRAGSGACFTLTFPLREECELVDEAAG
jgi:signal transduction histidine kinase